MYITKLKALQIAVSVLENQPSTKETEQSITRLKTMLNETNITHWTKELVFKRLNQWQNEHHRNPTVTNLTEPDMPKATTIQKLFDMKASAFMHIYYPTTEKRKSTSAYTIKTKEEWIKNFYEQYNKIKPTSGNDYNAKRDNGTPTWMTIARYCGISRWNELLKISQVNTSHLKQNPTPRIYTVHCRIPLYEKLEKLLDEQKSQNELSNQNRKK